MAIDLASGTKLAGGRYVLQRRLGAGGMAAVWKAYDERLERPVAVKVLSDALAGDEAYAERFRREARLAARLSHPHLVSVFDFAAEDERPYLVMELVEGPTLADLLRSPRTRDVDAGTLAIELLGALEHIHDAGIIHRDVKPSNVLVGPDGRSRLTDFGVAQPPDATALTAAGNVVGTMRYLAPELLSGERATPRSDLYACGVLLTEALGPDTDPVVRALISRLTEADPSKRPPSAARALAELEAGREGTTEVTRTAVTRPVSPSRRSPAHRTVGPPVLVTSGRTGTRVALVLVAAVLVIIIALVAGAGSGRGPASRRGLEPAPPASAPLTRQLDALERAGHTLAHR